MRPNKHPRRRSTGLRRRGFPRTAESGSKQPSGTIVESYSHEPRQGEEDSRNGYFSAGSETRTVDERAREQTIFLNNPFLVRATQVRGAKPRYTCDCCSVS